MTETTHNRLAAVLQKLEILDAEAREKSRQACTLYSLRDKLQAQILMEEKLLAGSWAIKSIEHELELGAVGDWPGLQKARKFLHPGCPVNYFLWSTETFLRLDGDVMTLSIRHPDAVQFIKDHGIIVKHDEHRSK